MSDNKLKPLVIKSGSTPAGALNEWTSMTGIFPTFTKQIITPAIGDDSGDDTAKGNLGPVVSGMPTVFARANLFLNAIENVTDTDQKTAGLLSFYKSLVDEWRGLIACLALNYNDINVRRISLTYSDGKDINETENIYEPKGAFGNVLFDRKPLWCDQSAAVNAKKTPFIDIIKYKNQVVGATSPDSFLFTSVSYELSGSNPFVSPQTKRFTDPFESNILPEQVKLIYSYVSYLINNVNKFRANFDNLDPILKPNYSNINGTLGTWIKEIKLYAEKNDIKLGEQIPEVGCFQAPFSTLFNYSTELYGEEGLIYNSQQGNAIPFKPIDLLLNEATSEIASIDCGANVKDYLVDRSLYLLKATTKGEPNNFVYFALPLSPLGINVFGKNLGALIGTDKANIKSRLYGEYDPEADTLKVTLKLVTQTNVGISKTLNFKVAAKMIEHKDILIWPNFISKLWGKYYMYNEMPHNSPTWSAVPMVVNTNDEYLRIHCDEKENPVFLASNGRASDDSIATLKISYNNSVADNPYKYEIYESNRPYKGVKFSFQGKIGGFAIIKYGMGGATSIKNKMQDLLNLKEGALGVDFGSTNSSVAYYSMADNRMMDTMKLENRRVSLLRSDEKDNDKSYAVEDEIFFFQNNGIYTNSIKSVLALHDSKRVVSGAESQTTKSLFSEIIKGGIPCFEQNMPIDGGTSNRYFLQYEPMPEAEIGVGKVDLVHNMKWSSHELENSHKEAYLKGVLMHIYAQMFEENHFPKTLKWSYPSSMSQLLIGQYAQIWSTLNTVNPLVNGDYDLKVFGHGGGNGIVPGDEEGNEGTWGNDDDDDDGWGNDTGNSFSEKPDSLDDDGRENEHSNNNKSTSGDIDSGPLRFDFVQLNEKESLTEACAVANYLASNTKINKNKNYLTICFDIGGSTTDISAMCQMKGGPKGMGWAMVKQSSIRFAARRISQATSHSKGFLKVLKIFLERKGILIEGVNRGTNKYNANTAPYYFEQLVDRLEDADFPEFYKLLEAECKDLVAINYYVTGLIMYYAGQLAHKLKIEIDGSPDKAPGMDNWKPLINIVFTGKGARIFDWFRYINENTSESYYRTLFIKGFGGKEMAKKHLSGPPKMNPINSSTDLKYEVSKGLAYKNNDPSKALLVPRKNIAVELIGEEGFQLLSNDKTIDLPYDTSINGKLFEQLGTFFISSPADSSKPCPKFMEFAKIYYKVASELLGLPLTQSDFMEGFKNMNIEAYVTQLPEYQEALKSKKNDAKFDFSAPIIILEGMIFLEEVLMKKI
jgi:hypothetical protein